METTVDFPLQNGEQAPEMDEQQASPSAFSGDHLDVEAYAGLYTGRTKIMRLFFIADHCHDPAVQLEALRMAFEDICKTENTTLYKEVCEKIKGRLGPSYVLDADWVESVDRHAAQHLDKLETELGTYKTNLIKESIRMGFNDLGDFHYARGDLNQAFKCYVRTRDYCTTPKHVILMCLNAILASIELGNFNNVTTYVTKAEQTPDNLDPQVMAKLRVAAGLSLLESKKYKLAARKLVDTSIEIGNSYTDVIAPQDVATYGGLCALASFPRAELKSKVIDNSNFRQFLELMPEVRELIYDFYARLGLIHSIRYFMLGTQTSETQLSNKCFKQGLILSGTPVPCCCVQIYFVRIL